MIDSHAHLEMLENGDKKIQHAFQSGIKVILTIVDPSEEWEKALKIAEKYERVYLAAGVHPHNARKFDVSLEKILRKILSRDKVLALGEIGLDFYYMNSKKEVQLEVFARQLEIAAELNLPVVIHTREAFLETVEILEQYGFLNEKALFHCFSQGAKEAIFLKEKGVFLSFAGNFTYPKAANIREALVASDIDKILFETDCPFLTPQPKRGKKNEPLFVKYNYEEAAKLKNENLEDFISRIDSNFKNFFKKFDNYELLNKI